MSSKGPDSVTLIETNEVNQPTATYIYTESQEKPRNSTRTGRIDLIVCPLTSYLINLHHTPYIAHKHTSHPPHHHHPHGVGPIW